LALRQIFSRQSLGGDERDRTDDPLLAKQVLSQLSYTPILVGPPGSFFDTLALPEPQKLNNDFYKVPLT
jgi:hypothetical protein